MIKQKYDKDGNLEYLFATITVDKDVIGNWWQPFKPKVIVRIIDWLIITNLI